MFHRDHGVIMTVAWISTHLLLQLSAWFLPPLPLCAQFPSWLLSS